MSGVAFNYIDGEGGTLVLATTNRKLMGFGGVGMVAPEHYWQNLPDRDGSEHLGYRLPRRTMNFVVKGRATNRTNAWTQRQAIADAFSLDKGQGRIEATLPDGTVRKINARYAGGIDFSTEDSPIPTIQDYPIQLVCDSPYWEANTASTAQANFNGTATVNLNLSNGGDVDTYPTITVTSAVDHPSFILSGVGTLDVNVNLQSGTLTIDCADPSIEVGNASRMGSASKTSTFFQLARGGNTLKLSANSGSGLCTVEWTEQFVALKP